MDNNTGSLSINEDVIAKMAKLAALEVEGVEGLSAGSLKLNNVKKMLTPGSGVKGVFAKVDDGVIYLDLLIKVKAGMQVKKIAEEVQVHVKDKIQDMTGFAVTAVNVTVADVDTTVKPETEEE